MQDGFELVNPDGAHTFLKCFEASARRKGEEYVQKGAVRDLTVEEPGREFSARVVEEEVQDVRIFYDDDPDVGLGWTGECSCPEEIECAHIFAVARALMAEHSAAVVRKLSSNTVGTPVRKASRASKKAVAGATDLRGKLQEALGRPLKPEETKFVGKVKGVYTRCRQAKHITHWDFEEMGLSLGGYGWNALEIWPALPAGEHEFWLYVAHAARERGVAIPPFMEPVTDLDQIQGLLAKWQRSREIEKWNQTLGNLAVLPEASLPKTEGETDLRLLIDQDELRLQCRRPGQLEFESLKQAQFHQLSRACEQNEISFTAPSEWLWSCVGELLHFGFSIRWTHLDPKATRLLGRLLRSGLLDTRIVDATGRLLARPSDPLRWEIIEASGAEDDYRLRLVQANGSPAPPFLAALPGNPMLYLTREEVFSGPPWPHATLDPAKETRIPAPALERASGVTFLRNLGVELPERLKARVQTVPYQITIRCELRPSVSVRGAEDCVFSATANAPDGRSLTWAGYNWLEKKKAPRQRPQEDGAITIYDSAALNQAHSLLDGLQLKPDYLGHGFATRVTKKFPDLFSSWLKSVPPHIAVHLGGDLASFTTAEVSGRVKLDVTEAEIDWFDLRVVLDVADTTLTSEEIQLLFKAKGEYVRLAGKGWRRLQVDVTDDENERLAHLGLSAQELSAEPQRLHAFQLAHEAAKRFLPAHQVERLQRRADELKTRVTPKLPSGVTAEFRPYQIEGFHFLAYLVENRFGGILADDMGLGKTLQTLAWLLWLRERTGGAEMAPHSESPSAAAASSRAGAAPKPLSPALVVCPKSVMDNWQAEAARFTPGLRVRVWSASNLGRFLGELDQADLHVLNYSQLRNLGESLVTVSWKAVILDEGQYIKNPNSQTAQVARSLRAEHRLVLSGTPIENRLLDLWSLMMFVMPGVLGSRARFAKLYDAKGDPFARRRLASRVRPFLLRRTKSQVAKDLPDRTEEDLFCEMEGEQLALYRAELKRAQQLLLGIKTQKELAQQQFHFLVSLLRLRQICCDPRLRKPDSTAPSAKTDALVEQLEPLMEEGQKVLVFSQFVELLDLLRPVLAGHNWPVFYLAGDTENRGELVRQFQSAEGPAVFLISLKAGGFGLNLTAASYVVLFDPWWNPAVENQAIDRTHRIGQVNKVIAYRLLIKNSIEEKIRELQKKKQALAQDVLGEERFAQSLTLEDLQTLFAD